MTPKPKSKRDLKLEQEIAARLAQVKAQVAAARNRPKKKPVNLWLAIPLMSAIGGLYLWGMYHRHGSWSAVFHYLLNKYSWESLRHTPWTTWFGPALVAAMWIGLGIYSLRTSLRKKKQEKEKTDWFKQLQARVDLDDYPDQRYLYYDLEPAQRSRLLDTLQRMPKGSRSLRQAVAIVAPDLLEDID